jgi:phage terminase small subunit
MDKYETKEVLNDKYDIKSIKDCPIYLSKLKNFMWLVRKKILTKDNLVKKGWVGDTSCVFCDAYEDIDHLFVRCSVAYTLWNWIVKYNSFIF